MKNKVRVLAPTATYVCAVCNHSWIPRKPGKPKRCAACKTPHWEEGDTFMQIAGAIADLNIATERMELALTLVASAKERIEKATGVEVA